MFEILLRISHVQNELIKTVEPMITCGIVLLGCQDPGVGGQSC